MSSRVAAAVCASVLVVGLSAGCGGGSSKLSLTVYEDPPTLNRVDLPPPGPSPGDTYYFFATFRDQPGGAVTGELYGTKTVVKPAAPATPNVEQRATTLYFVFGNNQDQIVAAGVPDYPPNASEFQPNRPVLRAILGGTGKYDGVGGELTSTRNADGSYKQEFALTKP
jgi:hypothetical protein